MRLPLSPQVYMILDRLIEDHAGLHYEARDADVLADKASARAIERGFQSLLDYYYFLRYDPEGPRELDALIETMAIHETYFFREADGLRLIVEEQVVPLCAKGERPRLWCAAAATGEEPLTLAMLLAERGLLDRVDLVASDVSERALGIARRGVFGKRSLRALPPGYEAWLRVEGDRAIVAPSLVAAVRWQRVNLLDRTAIESLGTFDAIACRNVLIYFRDSVARRVTESVSRALRPGGTLLVGVSESLLRYGTLLRCEERRGVFFYQRERT